MLQRVDAGQGAGTRFGCVQELGPGFLLDLLVAHVSGDKSSLEEWFGWRVTFKYGFGVATLDFELDRF